MYIINENEREYRFGDSGPKYLMNHNVMEENFFILEGKIDIVVDGKVNTLSAGDLIHIEPSEVHYCINNYDVPVKMISTLAPYQEVDKVEVENYTYEK